MVLCVLMLLHHNWWINTNSKNWWCYRYQIDLSLSAPRLCLRWRIRSSVCWLGSLAGPMACARLLFCPRRWYDGWGKWWWLLLLLLYSYYLFFSLLLLSLLSLLSFLFCSKPWMSLRMGKPELPRWIMEWARSKGWSFQWEFAHILLLTNEWPILGGSSHES